MFSFGGRFLRIVRFSVYLQFLSMTAISFSPHSFSMKLNKYTNKCSSVTFHRMSFYDDFEDFEFNEERQEEDDDDDDDDEYSDVDDAAVADFRSRMGSMFGETPEDEDKVVPGLKNNSSVDDLIQRATSSGASEDSTSDWAKPIELDEKIEAGMILIANPAKFCSDFGDKVKSPSTSLLNKFGLTLPPPADLGPDRRADLLPVLCIIDRHPLRGSHAVLLNRRTGYLLGDLEQQAGEDGLPPPPPRLGAFMIQPLWFGGTSSGSNQESSSSSGLDMLHQCSVVDGAKKLTDDGLFWGGDPAQAQDALSDSSLDRVYTGFDFRFFVQSTRWLPLALEREIREGTWYCASVSKEVLFKPRDRMGTRRAKPLWTEIMELMGGEYLKIRNDFYSDDAPFP